MRIFFHNADLSANAVQSVFFQLFFTLIVFSSLRFIKFFANVYRVDAHVDNFVHFFECAIFSFSFMNIDRILFENEKLIKLRDNRVVIDFKYIERKKRRATVFKKFFYIFIIFGFACVVTDQFDFKFKFLNVNFDFSFLFFFFRFRIQMK